MSIEKRKDGTGYDVRWRDSAGKQRKRKVTLWRDAVSLDGEMKRKKAMGELIVHEKGKLRLRAFWDVWWERYALVHLRPQTRESYRAVWRKHIEPALGNVSINAVSQESVVDLIAALKKKGLSTSSIRKAVMVLQSPLQRAVEWRYINANPAASVRKPTPDPRRGRVLSQEQLEALLSELDLRSRSIAGLLAYTGIRPGEMRALRWGDIRDAVLVVERAISSDEIGPTKNRKQRAVVLNDQARKTLIQWRLASGVRDPEVLIFPAVRGRGHWTDDGYRLWSKRTFADATTRAGLQGLVPYDLRHTFVSRLIAEGHDIYWIARQAGHDPTMTLSTYAHLFDSRGKVVPSECPANWLDSESISPLGDSNP